MDNWANVYARKMVGYLGEKYFNKYIFDLVKEDLQLKYEKLLIENIGINKNDFLTKNVPKKYHNLSVDEIFNSDWNWNGDCVFYELIKIVPEICSYDVEGELGWLVHQYVSQIFN